MIQNLKIDIIYYNTPSDFEFEFNLGGCCHSRVLNSKSNTPKEMVTALSKAVGRSRVIMLLGKLNESDGLFSLVSKAIGANLENVDANEYNISNVSDTTVISGALPLVSTDGMLGGCILESGPQSIIIMSEEKAVRKDIAENLVFKYITAISRTPETESVVTPDSMPEETAEAEFEDVSAPADEVTTPIEEDAVETIEAQSTEDTQFISSATAEISNDEDISEVEAEATEGDSEDFILSNNDPVQDVEISAETEEEINFISNDDFIDIFAEEKSDIDMDDNFIYNDTKKQDILDNYEPKEKPKSVTSGSNTFIWIIIALMFIVAAILTYMLVLTPIQKDISVIDYIKQVFNL